MHRITQAVTAPGIHQGLPALALHPVANMAAQEADRLHYTR